MERRRSTGLQHRHQAVNQQTKYGIKQDIEDDLDEAVVPVNDFQLIYVCSSRSANYIFWPRVGNYLEQVSDLSAKNLPVINQALLPRLKMQRRRYYSVRRSPKLLDEHDNQRMRLRTNNFVFEVAVEYKPKSVLSFFLLCFSGIL